MKHQEGDSNGTNTKTSRRTFLAGATAATAAGFTATTATAVGEEPLTGVPPEDYRIQNGRIKQSVMRFIFKLSAEEMMQACHRMGMHAIEGVGSGRDTVEKARKLGLTVSIAGVGGSRHAPLDRATHEQYFQRAFKAIDNAADLGIPNLLLFSGYRKKGISDTQAKNNCIEAWKRLAERAEQKKVTLCLEILNSRDTSGWMTGHAGYFGDDIDLCADMVNAVDSRRMKLLFDIYHVQVMNGDLIRRIHQYKDIIGHIHTAGVPGRNELDETQEINYPAVMRALLEVGYTGYVAHEFIPTWDDKLAALRHAVRLCDV